MAFLRTGSHCLSQAAGPAEGEPPHRPSFGTTRRATHTTSMGGWGDLRRGAATVLFCRVAVSHAQSPWCNNAAAPTAAAYNCGGRVGMVCPSATEVTEWGDPAVRAWAGYEMVECSETGAFARPNDIPKVVRRCNGENDCIAEGGRCRVENGVPICSSDETGCGGLVDQIISRTVVDPTSSPTRGVGLPTCTGALEAGVQCPGVLAADQTAANCATAGCVFTPACSESVTSGCNAALAMGNPLELRVGSSLQSSWMVPYNRVMGTYSYAMCVTYGEIADTEVRRDSAGVCDCCFKLSGR